MNAPEKPGRLGWFRGVQESCIPENAESGVGRAMQEAQEAAKKCFVLMSG